MIYVLYTIGAIISFLLFYFVVKFAVKNAIIETFNKSEVMAKAKGFHSETYGDIEKMKLQKLYENGEISFNEYKEKWAKLS
jgi:hypothetical protein